MAGIHNKDRSGEVSILDSIPVYTGEQNVASWLEDTGLSVSEFQIDYECEQSTICINVGTIQEQVKVVDIIPSSASVNSRYLLKHNL